MMTEVNAKVEVNMMDTTDGNLDSQALHGLMAYMVYARPHLQ